MLSKELQIRKSSNVLYYGTYVLLFRLKSIITRLFKQYTNKTFRKLLRFICKIISQLLSLAKWLLAPKYLFKIAIRHGILLLLLFTTPILGNALFRPLTNRLNKEYTMLTKGKNYYKKHTQLNNYIKNECKSFEKWESASSALDEMEGKHEWIMTDKSKYYNYKKLYYDTIQLKKYLSKCRRHDKLKQTSIFSSSSLSTMTSTSRNSLIPICLRCRCLC